MVCTVLATSHLTHSGVASISEVLVAVATGNDQNLLRNRRRIGSFAAGTFWWLHVAWHLHRGEKTNMASMAVGDSFKK